MGFDLYGVRPTSVEGEYFRNSIWRWHPLWTYCESVAPDLLKENRGHSNEGWGLDAAGAMELARVLREEVRSGRTAIYEREHDPAEMDQYGPMGEMLESLVAPYGGFARPSVTFTTGNIVRFIEFLEHCGGFAIW
jgi:hypothetical protein